MSSFISLFRLHLYLLDFDSFSAEDHDEPKTPSDPSKWVALAIVQSYSQRRKVPRSDISMADLEVCLAKASFSAAKYSGRVFIALIWGLGSLPLDCESSR